jgi:hypothetical protein
MSDDLVFEFAESLRGMEIADVIVELNAYWKRTWMKDPYSINCGDCELYSHCLCIVFPEAKSHWGEELLTQDEFDDDAIRDIYEWHCITEYQGRYYDSEHPFGVANFKSISAFHSSERPR